MLVAVLVTLFALRGARVGQELGALAVSVQREGNHDGFVALLAVSANYRLLLN